MSLTRKSGNRHWQIPITSQGLMPHAHLPPCVYFLMLFPNSLAPSCFSYSFHLQMLFSFSNKCGAEFPSASLSPMHKV